MVVTKPKVVPNNKMKIVKQKTKKKMTQAQDAAYDRKHGIKTGSKQDKAMDQKNGVMYKVKSKTKTPAQKAYLKRVGTKGMGASC